jgi:hypothetical protein
MPKASHGLRAGRRGLMPCARRQRKERRRLRARRSSSVIAVMRCKGLLLSAKLTFFNGTARRIRHGERGRQRTGNEPPAQPKSGEHDQASFLARAAQGRDVWNAWRRNNKDLCVTFADVDFRIPPRHLINFEGFEFGDHADFSGCTWGDRAFFANATFGDYANFNNAAFGDWANFANAAFGEWARFNGAAFGDWADFRQSRFKGSAQFASAQFARIPAWQRVTSDGSAPDRFLFISFAGARFGGAAIFSGRTFESTIDFTGAHFYFPPEFSGVTNTDRIDFTGAYIGFVRPGKRHWTKDSRIPVGLRALRKIAEETKNHDLERDLYIKEREAERGVYLSQRWKELRSE